MLEIIAVGMHSVARDRLPTMGSVVADATIDVATGSLSLALRRRGAR